MKEEDVHTLIRYRLEQAQAALDDATFLLEGRRSAQSIVNRAYYAMFYAALALLQKLGKIPSKHSGVISLFDVEFVRKEIFSKEMSKDFHKAFELRQASDYKTFELISMKKAEQTVAKATDFVRIVKAYFNIINFANKK